MVLDLDTIIPQLKWNDAGLIPVIVQDDQTQQVLMVAWVNEEALRRTVESGETHFWSRSRRMLWHKGETSGNTQTVTSIWVDCDADVLLIKVRPVGPACHLGDISCFSRKLEDLGE